MRNIKIKICCISSLEEAELALSYGASAIGLVSEMPSGPGVISENLIRDIARSVPADIETFLLTSKQSTDLIIEQLDKCRTTTVQIVDELTAGTYNDIRTEFPNIKIVQVIHINSKKDIKLAEELSLHTDALLLDSGNQNLMIKKLGGTGKVHNWAISKEIVKKVNIPVYLAGGINHMNVREAISTVNPYGIDLCSSVRTDDKLDSIKLRELFDAVKN